MCSTQRACGRGRTGTHFETIIAADRWLTSPTFSLNLSPWTDAEQFLRVHYLLVCLLYNNHVLWRFSPKIGQVSINCTRVSGLSQRCDCHQQNVLGTQNRCLDVLNKMILSKFQQQSIEIDFYNLFPKASQMFTMWHHPCFPFCLPYFDIFGTSPNLLSS